jgi:hypothetical protein
MNNERSNPVNGTSDPTVISEHADPTPEERIAERERAIAILQFLPSVHDYTLYCRYTGVPIAKMELIQQAGKLPYLAQWQDSVAFHPLFALSQNQLLSWTRKNWNQLFRETIDRSTPLQRQQFAISFMAILHSMKCIEQTVPALPQFDTVVVNMQRLLELAYWYNFLESRRFKFPTLRINKINANSNLRDIAAYLDVCESVKHDYETNKDTAKEEAKLEAARRAEKAVRNSHVRPISKKMLWNWFLSSMADSNSKKYTLPEWQEWKEDSAKLWLASESTQLQFSLEDVDSIEDVFLEVCSLGTSVSNAFKVELGKIRTNISNHLKVFEIDWTATIKGSEFKRVDASGEEVVPEGPPEPGPAPTQLQFFSRVDYLRAEAKWKLAKLQYDAWQKKYNQPPTGSGIYDSLL